ncbi:MAG: hypothetical protein KF757_01625 [Phycisphaeraceae bacterium]|nr:hypothetical protein [Phycisphaeraceae bacterium]MCW5761910.1 hypothetical protein [Phycisphaeraceae bacterium]
MRIVLAAILGGIALFMWGFVYWVVISPNFSAISSMSVDRERAITASLNENMPADGVYFFPGFEDHGKAVSEEDKKRLDEEWRVRHQEGPIGMIVYRRAGSEPQQPGQFLGGFLINIASAFFVACLIAISGAAGFVRRFAMVLFFGLAASFATHGLQWNWFRFPTPYTIFQMIDVIGGWTVAGVVIGAIAGHGTHTSRPVAAPVHPTE